VRFPFLNLLLDSKTWSYTHFDIISLIILLNEIRFSPGFGKLNFLKIISFSDIFSFESWFPLTATNRFALHFNLFSFYNTTGISSRFNFENPQRPFLDKKTFWLDLRYSGIFENPLL